jgi:hypothetical protein
MGAERANKSTDYRAAGQAAGMYAISERDHIKMARRPDSGPLVQAHREKDETQITRVPRQLDVVGVYVAPDTCAPIQNGLECFDRAQ